MTICREIAASMNAAISLENRLANGKIAGLDARGRFPATRVLPSHGSAFKNLLALIADRQ